MCLAQGKPVLYNSDLEQLVVRLHLLLGLNKLKGMGNSAYLESNLCENHHADKK